MSRDRHKQTHTYTHTCGIYTYPHTQKHTHTYTHINFLYVLKHNLQKMPLASSIEWI